MTAPFTQHLQLSWSIDLDPSLGPAVEDTLLWNMREGSTQKLSALVKQGAPPSTLYLLQHLPQLSPMTGISSTPMVEVRSRVLMQEEDDVELNRDFWEFAKEERIPPSRRPQCINQSTTTPFPSLFRPDKS